MMVLLFYFLKVVMFFLLKVFVGKVFIDYFDIDDDVVEGVLEVDIEFEVLLILVGVEIDYEEDLFVYGKVYKVFFGG